MRFLTSLFFGFFATAIAITFAIATFKIEFKVGTAVGANHFAFFDHFFIKIDNILTVGALYFVALVITIAITVASATASTSASAASASESATEEE